MRLNTAHKPSLEMGTRSAPTDLALGKLEPLASAFLTVFLPFMRARIAGQETCRLEPRPKLGIKFDQRPCDSQPGSTCLADGTAAIRENEDVELVGHFRGEQRLTNNKAGGFIYKIMFKGTAIDCNLALARTAGRCVRPIFSGDPFLNAVLAKLALNIL